MHFIMICYDKCFGYTFCMYFARNFYITTENYQMLAGQHRSLVVFKERSLNTNVVMYALAIQLRDINQHTEAKEMTYGYFRSLPCTVSCLMGLFSSLVATSILSLVSFGISTIKLNSFSLVCNGMLCQGEIYI